MTLGIERVARAAADGWPCAWMAPTYKYLEEVWEPNRVVLEPVVRTKANSNTGSRCTAEAPSSAGVWTIRTPAVVPEYRPLVVDEAALVHNLETVLQASLRPTLSVLGGDAWFLSTPKGLDAFHHLYQLGQDPLQTEWKSWQLPPRARVRTSPTRRWRRRGASRR